MTDGLNPYPNLLSGVGESFIVVHSILIISADPSGGLPALVMYYVSP